MKSHVFFESDTGRIKKTRFGTGADPDAPSGQSVMEGIADAETQYVSGGALVSRPIADLSPLASATLGDTITLTGLPEGAVVSASPGNSDTVGADGEIDVTFPDATSITISVAEIFPWRAASIDLEIS